jgi:hypothetical protein
MMILGIDPRDNRLRWPIGSPYQIRVQFSDGAGGLIGLAGRELRFAAFRSGGDVVFDAPFIIDGNTATVVFPGSVSLTPGLDGGAWQVAQLFEGGATPLFRGSVITVDAAADQGAGAGAPPSDLLTWAPATQTLLVSSIGARGPSLSEELGTTPEKLIEELVTGPIAVKLAAVDVTVAGKVDQVDDAITELGEFTSERSAEIDAVIADAGTQLNEALGDFERVQVLANILIPSGATAILADSGNAIQIGDMM